MLSSPFVFKVGDALFTQSGQVGVGDGAGSLPGLAGVGNGDGSVGSVLGGGSYAVAPWAKLAALVWVALDEAESEVVVAPEFVVVSLVAGATSAVTGIETPEGLSLRSSDSGAYRGLRKRRMKPNSVSWGACCRPLAQ